MSALRRIFATTAAAGVLGATLLGATALPGMAITSTAGSAGVSSARVVPGLAYSQGYWSTHLNLWPCGYSPDQPFFLSGQTWGQVLQSSAQGGVYYQLAQQYIAATLNIANGAVPDQATLDAYNTASYYFTNANQTTELTADQLATVKSLIPVLENYNLGHATVGTVAQCTYQMARELKIRQ